MKSKYRVWCLIDEKYVLSDWLDTAPTVCPENPAHGIDSAKTTATPSESLKKSSLSFSFSSDSINHLNISSDTYEAEALILFEGSNIFGPISSIKILHTRKSGAGITMDIKIYDTTNDLTLVEKSLSAPATDQVFELADLGTILNVPTGLASLEVLCKVGASGAGKVAWLAALMLK